MKIVIDIDEREWMDEKSIREVAFEYEKGCGFDRAIREGLRQAIVIPKGHGRIIDESKINTIYCETEMELYGSKIRYIKKTDAPTIIEADKGSDNE